MKPHRDISNWVICRIHKRGYRIYAQLEIERREKEGVFYDFLLAGTLQSIVKRIEKELK